MTVLLLLVGMAMLLAGGRLLVESAVGFAGRMGVPSLLVGLTLVAWGTSAPELALNFAAAIQDRPALVFGNIVGANICNLGLVLGICALVRPLVCETTVVSREIPLTLAMLGGLVALAAAPTPEPWHFGRIEGALLLVGFLVYSVMTIRQGLRPVAHLESAVDGPAGPDPQRSATRPGWILLLLFVGGIALLAVGGHLAADAASELARMLGMSEKTIGVTVVAVGTTLPELATSFMAIRAGQVDLAVGNALGSCIFNVGFIFGITVLIAPSDVPTGGVRSMFVMVLLAALLIPMSRTSNGTVGRLEGALLLAIYAASVVYELWAGT